MDETQVFEWALSVGLQDNEIRRQIDAGLITERDLRESARRAQSDILATARSEQETFEAVNPFAPFVLWAARIAVALVPVVAGLGFVLPFGWWWIVATVVTALVLFFLVAVDLWIPGGKRFLASYPNRARADWMFAMAERGVLPVLRAEVNSVDVTRGTTLPFTDSKGLFGGTPLVAHQRTLAGERLAELVRSVNGGSFALAGPRGVGKTNLLRAFCAGTYAVPDQPEDLTVLASAPVEYVPREFLLHLYAEICRAVIARGNAPHLVKAAKSGLVSIAYVQTRSNEVSGKYGFKGAEISLKRGDSMAGRAPTYPEVVNDFRAFVQALGRVVIAIDEIDRIGAGEQARRFLSELKAIFDIPGCYYLVSVSTEAQHDFELSGMGLRSVFDSSFDEVIRVDYLDFDLARRLLGRLVIGLPEQFAALAYVFSGGLARQLIRAARDVLRHKEGTTLSEVARTLANDELYRVCETTSDALTALDDPEGVTTLLRALMSRPVDLQGVYQGESKAVRELRDLAAARIRFLEVVVEIFTDGLDEVLLDDLDALARARRYVGSNPVTGLALLEEFSAAWTARPAPTRPPR
ncbi:P-loop NTPase fold protein [Lentzea flava]|uniref:P-loop NTPase fold protein n=1 Tax=Lentzea flava TaxID=103732 RepID=UPI00166FD997|nr:P-loop NTPase fold protein [Lentzea flava]